MTRKLTLSIALLLSHALACGDPDAGADFVGTWTYSSGTTTTISCEGLSKTEPLTGALSIVAEIDADLAIADESGCITKYDVAGDIATARPNQSCGAADGPNALRRISDVSLLRNGSTLTINERGTLIAAASRLGRVCSYIRAGLLKRK
jgi:hypothetical protein